MSQHWRLNIHPAGVERAALGVSGVGDKGQALEPVVEFFDLFLEKGRIPPETAVDGKAPRDGSGIRIELQNHLSPFHEDVQHPRLGVDGDALEVPGNPGVGEPRPVGHDFFDLAFVADNEEGPSGGL
jgi:hypothetical protein